MISISPGTTRSKHFCQAGIDEATPGGNQGEPGDRRDVILIFLSYRNHSLALITVQPSISTVHGKTLNNLSKVRYSLIVFVKSNPRPLDPSPNLPPALCSQPSDVPTFRRSHPVPSYSPTDHCPLTIETLHQLRSGNPDRVGTVHPRFKSFSCNTHGSPRKCCKQKTYGHVKPFRCNTYKKQGEGARLWLTRNLNNPLLAPDDKSNSLDSGGRTSPATCCAQRSPAGSILWIAL